MKTLADLEAKIREHFQQEEADQKVVCPVHAFGIRTVEGWEEKLVNEMWNKVFEPRVGGKFKICWRRRLGFQISIPNGRILSMRASFQEAT